MPVRDCAWLCMTIRVTTTYVVRFEIPMYDLVLVDVQASRSNVGGHRQDPLKLHNPPMTVSVWSVKDPGGDGVK